jgi:hypothetical protein
VNKTTREDQVLNNKDFVEIERNIVRDSKITDNKKKEEVVKKDTRTSQEFVNRRITVEVDKAHEAFARSLRCVTPPNERVSTPNLSRGNRSPSHDTTRSDTSKVSSTHTRKSSTDIKNKNEDFMRSTASSERRSSRNISPEKHPHSPKPHSADKKPQHEINSTFVTTKVDHNDRRSSNITKNIHEENITTSKIDRRSTITDDNTVVTDRRSSSPQKIPQTFKVIPEKKTSSIIDQTQKLISSEQIDTTKTVRRSISPQKQPQSPKDTLERQNKIDITSTEVLENLFTSDRRSTSPQKAPQNTPRESSPTKPLNDRKSPQKINKKTSQVRTEENLLTTTIDIKSEDNTHDHLKVTQTIDSKTISPTTSVSDLEYIHNPNDSRLITDLDSEDIIEININIENLDESDDLKITTIVTEVNESDVTDKTKTTNATKTVRRSISPQKQPQSPKDTLDRKTKVERTKVDETDVSRSQQGMYRIKFLLTSINNHCFFLKFQSIRGKNQKSI